MSLKKINPENTHSWKLLNSLYRKGVANDLRTLFEEDKNRVSKYTISWQDFLVDYSKNKIEDTVMASLFGLAKEVNLKETITKYFSGYLLNHTEQRPVLHTALRATQEKEILVDGENIIEIINKEKRKIKDFTESIHTKQRKGYTGKAFTHIVSIGIGGSYLGSIMVLEALKFYRQELQWAFISNVDGDYVFETLRELDPETTLFVIISKSFTTQETLTNATTVKKWFLNYATHKDIVNHFVAVSANVENVKKFGIPETNIFPFWDWVGGRFSLWSAVGLPISLSLGYSHFEALLDGAREMDEHFKNTPFEKNIPIILGLLEIWYHNFHKIGNKAIVPYTEYLSNFPAYLQQLVMESNGKSVDRNGNPIGYQTGGILWGSTGTNAQHAFFQWVHQGTQKTTLDFIGYKYPLYEDTEHHHKLMANFFAQTEALMLGKTESKARKELSNTTMDSMAIEALLPFKVFKGNHPTTTILIDKLTPKSLGKLIALYEHKILVQGVIWNINSYDQWGVEFGKQLASKILQEFEDKISQNHDSSTLQLLEKFRQKT